MADTHSITTDKSLAGVDVTPDLLSFAYGKPTRLLQVRPDASVHEYAALIWIWTNELRTLATLAAPTSQLDGAISPMDILADRLAALENVATALAELTKPGYSDRCE